MAVPKIICMTPVKNESWILDRFLKCASLWADNIIIADQMSDGGSAEIASNYPKVTIVKNESPIFNEPERQELLIQEARKIPGPRLLIALDSDEFLTSDFMFSPEWDTIIKAPEGTVIRFQLPVILPDLRSYWMPKFTVPMGYMDDGAKHVGRKIHSPRIPIPNTASTIVLREIKVMHYVGIDSDRWESKHRWYQCWEHINQPQKSAVDIFRQYHRKDVIPDQEIKPMPSKWLKGYESHCIDMTSSYREPFFQTDKMVLDFLLEHGPEKFRHIDIWNVDWSDCHKKIYGHESTRSLKDPRNRFEKIVHYWLRQTQYQFTYFSRHRTNIVTRIIQSIIKCFGW